MKFKTSSGVKSIVGKDLITDRYIAIFELVKNSYDARATEVIVSFNRGEDTQEGFGKIDKHGKIYIVDNGCGMSKDDLQNKWLFLAYSDKQEGKAEALESENDNAVRRLKNRVFVGSKGIGRFSSDRLGSLIRIITKVENEDFEHEIVVDWDEFDKNLKNKFEDIPVEYKTSKNLTRKDVSSYTIIEISHLREDWNDEMLNGVKEKLRRLKNPFVETDDLLIYCGLDIFNLKDDFIGSSNTAITSNIAEVIKEKSINITAKIKGKNIRITLTDRGKTIYKIQSTANEALLRNVDGIDISINYLTISAKSTFTRRMGVEPVNYGNIFIYRNGFHVSPYGEFDSDLFSLNSRKTQGYKRYLATRELIGFISISDSRNYFKETSSRNNGFIQNGYFQALEEFYMDFIQRPLERYVQLINFGEMKDKKNKKNIIEQNTKNIEISQNEKEKFKKYIVKKGFEVKEFDENLDFESNKPEKIIERIKSFAEKPIEETSQEQIKQDAKKLEKQFKAIQEENKEVTKAAEESKKQVNNLIHQNKNLIKARDPKSFGEQLTHHITILAERLDFAIDSLIEIKGNIQSNELYLLNNALEDINSTKAEMEIFRSLLLKTNYDLKSPGMVNWFDLADWYFQDGGRHSYYKIFKVTCTNLSDNGFWNIESSHIQVVMMFENFYKNAFEHGANFIDFEFSENNLSIINDSQPLDENNLVSIFDKGFSTKENGTGIGLHQIKSFLTDIGFKITAFNKDGLVNFNIVKE